MQNGKSQRMHLENVYSKFEYIFPFLLPSVHGRRKIVSLPAACISHLSLWRQHMDS